jgi:hypothetical protein
MASAAMGGGEAGIEVGRVVSLIATAYPYLTGGDHVTSRKTMRINQVPRPATRSDPVLEAAPSRRHADMGRALMGAGLDGAIPRPRWPRAKTSRAA